MSLFRKQRITNLGNGAPRPQFAISCPIGGKAFCFVSRHRAGAKRRGVGKAGIAIIARGETCRCTIKITQ